MLILKISNSRQSIFQDIFSAVSGHVVYNHVTDNETKHSTDKDVLVTLKYFC